MSRPPIRPGRLLAIARRDLAIELGGRRGWILPAITGGLLLPASSVDFDRFGKPPEGSVVVLPVAGDVPDAVLAVPGVRVVPPERAAWRFTRGPDGLHVDGRGVPDEIRAALDGPSPSVDVVDVRTPGRVPGRSMLLALLAASLLTGAVSESLPGERSRHTMDTLLSASITRAELVLGKWLAWTGYGAGSAVLAAAVAVLAGRQEAGWWLLPLPFVPAATVALGLFLVRRSADIVGGSTVTLRVLPALLSVSAIAAWVVGRWDERFGALLPLGGALVAAGGTWEGAAPALIATASTYLATIGLLAATIRDLGQDGVAVGGPSERTRTGAWAAVVGVAAWWTPIVGPIAWAYGGNALVAHDLPRAPAVAAGSLMLLLGTAVRASRTDEGAAELGLTRPRAQGLMAAVAVGAMLALGPPQVWAADGHWLGDARDRLAMAMDPSWAGIPLWVLAVAAQELTFRGWLRKGAGPWLAVAIGALVLSPTDPIRGLLVAGALVAVAEIAGSTWAPLAARLVAVAIVGVAR